MTTPDPARVLPDKVRRLEARVAVLEDALDQVRRELAGGEDSAA